VIAFTIERAAQEVTGSRKGRVHGQFVMMLKEAIRNEDIPARSAEGEPLLLPADLRAWVERMPEYHADHAAREARRVE
jgi:hypothetical protein